MKIDTQQIAAALTLVSAGVAASAQQTDPRTAAPPAAEVPAPAARKDVATVEIKGDYDPRRDDTASKTVIRHEDIIRYGDTDVYEVLKRAPGVTVIGESIRMRGLGNGYTQVLVNGERPPVGFQLRTVPPEQIERIEILRAASAEFSTRAIAGTVNVVLKKIVSKPQRDLRLNASHSDESDSAGVVGILADRSGKLSYTVTTFLTHGANRNPGSLTERFSAPDGSVRQLRDSIRRGKSDNTSLTLAPRLTWKLDNNGLLSWNVSVTAQRSDGDYATAYTNRIGSFSTPDYVNRITRNDGHGRFISSTLNWVTQLAGGKLDTSASVTAGDGSADNVSLSGTADQRVTLRRATDSDNRYANLRSSGKYARTMLAGHAMVTGWDVSRQQSRDDRRRVEGLVGAPPAEIPERFEPVVTQLAAFAQDEWNVTKQWSMYLGARWEGIRTRSAVSEQPDTASRSHVLSPIAQTLYKFPGNSGRQLRLALTRTYKAPTINELTARRIYADVNTRFTPDNSGNPDLKPELATGIDLTYEHFWAPAAVFSASVSNRRITDYIRTTLSRDSQGLWLYQPGNDGEARVRSVDLELKFPSKTVWPKGPAIDLRGSINRNWSEVSAVPGPDNRLDQQIPLTATLGADYRADPYSMGASFVFRSGGPVRISEQQSTRLQARRDLDLYVLYKITPKLQLRLTANNLLPKDNQTFSRYEDFNGVSENWGRSGYSRRWQLNLEIKL